uniref:Uncharacterized protein n=1 Tax=viral metagenome TaxID=1070528 RepID=A0A6C0JR78_9ZZZZ
MTPDHETMLVTCAVTVTIIFGVWSVCCLFLSFILTTSFFEPFTRKIGNQHYLMINTSSHIV